MGYPKLGMGYPKLGMGYPKLGMGYIPENGWRVASTYRLHIICTIVRIFLIDEYIPIYNMFICYTCMHGFCFYSPLRQRNL